MDSDAVVSRTERSDGSWIISLPDKYGGWSFSWTPPDSKSVANIFPPDPYVSAEFVLQGQRRTTDEKIKIVINGKTSTYGCQLVNSLELNLEKLFNLAELLATIAIQHKTFVSVTVEN